MGYAPYPVRTQDQGAGTLTLPQGTANLPHTWGTETPTQMPSRESNPGRRRRSPNACHCSNRSPKFGGDAPEAKKTDWSPLSTATAWPGSAIAVWLVRLVCLTCSIGCRPLNGSPAGNVNDTVVCNDTATAKGNAGTNTSAGDACLLKRIQKILNSTSVIFGKSCSGLCPFQSCTVRYSDVSVINSGAVVQGKVIFKSCKWKVAFILSNGWQGIWVDG